MHEYIQQKGLPIQQNIYLKTTTIRIDELKT